MRKLKTVLFISILPICALLYWVVSVFIMPDKFMKQIYLVPRDAIYIMETSDPANNWQQFSQGEIWQFLKQHPEMAEINQMALKLDSILHENKTYLDLLGKRQFTLSAHLTEPGTYDFLFIIDLEKLSKMKALSNQFDMMMQASDFVSTSRTYKDHEITQLYDPSDKSFLYIAFVDNHLLCSFTGSLIEKSIDEREDPLLGKNQYFVEVESKVANKGMAKFYLNYAELGRFVALFTPVPDPAINQFCANLNFTGLDMQISDTEISLHGSTGLATNVGYLPAFLASGHNQHTAHKVLSNRTALQVSIGFDDANVFMDNLEKAMQEDAQTYTEFKKNWDLTEKLLKIDIRKHFLSWLDGEVVFAQNIPGELGKQNEFVVLLKMNDKDNAITQLHLIEEQIRKRTPVKFKTVDYEGYEIHYLQIKGFFRLLFGKLFDRLDKPYYTIIDDFAVFSNSPATLLSAIEDYRQGNTLANDSEYTNFLSRFSKQSSIFTYCNMPKYFPLWKEFLSPQSWKDMQKNQIYFTSFTQIGMQMDGLGHFVDTRLISSFNKDNAIQQRELETAVDTLDLNEELVEEEEAGFVSSEEPLSAIQLFYLEKMQGNVFSEFYDTGELKSQTETEKGIKHGKHKSFYIDGKPQSIGKFKNNKKHGTWRYYNQEGDVVKKEKWKNGSLKVK